MRAIAKEIAQLQTSLGELHDCDVWMADLGRPLEKIARDAVQTDPDHDADHRCLHLAVESISRRSGPNIIATRSAAGSNGRRMDFCNSLTSLIGPRLKAILLLQR